MSDHVILHIDMNSFFASVEQSVNPFIRYKPVGVGAARKYDNAALLAISYEAKAKGVPKFARLREAKLLCPDIIAVPFDPIKYYSVNRRIVKIFQEYTPLVEVYSIDEAFLDLTPVLHLSTKTPVEIAQEIKDRIIAEVGAKLTSSVGISNNKLLAKLGSGWKKPDGLTVIPWEERLNYLDKLPIEKIWGIGHRVTAKLNAVGINSTAQIRQLEDSALRSLTGGYYTRLKMIANGQHYDRVDPNRNHKAAKSMQHAHTLSKASSDKEELKTVIRKMAERLAIRLRGHDQKAKVVYLGFKPDRQPSYGWGSPTRFSGILPLEFPSQHGKDVYDAACEIMQSFDLTGVDIRLIAVGVYELMPDSQLLFDIFTNPKVNSLDKAFDEINKTYGEFTLRTADILHQKAKESELNVERESMTFHPAIS